MRFPILTLMLALTAMQPACATGKGAGRVLADTVVPVSQENQMGTQMSTEVEAELKVLDNPQITAWVKGIGTKIAMSARSDIPKGIQFTFKVIDDDETVNAFAMPGGHIYVYTGLLKKAENEAEIAAVMGHEIAHVTRRHIAQRLTAMYGLGALGSLALGQNPGLLGELVSNVAANGYLLKHSRDAERDSDKHGMKYITGAGYSPMGYVTFFTKLGETPHPPTFLSSHPNPDERVANAKKAISKLGKDVVQRPLGTDTYKTQMATLN